VWRFERGTSKSVFYTSSAAERKKFLAPPYNSTYKYKGVAWYSSY